MTLEPQPQYSPGDQARLDRWLVEVGNRQFDQLLDEDGRLPPVPPAVQRIWTVEERFGSWPNGLGQLLIDSAISLEVADARGYELLLTQSEANTYGFSRSQSARINEDYAALLVPLWDVASPESASGWQMRPSKPDTRPKPRKYETPRGQRNFLDVNPVMRGKTLDPTQTLWITEGARKVDALASLGVPCIGLTGVWNWRGKDRPGDDSQSHPLAQWDALPLIDRRVVVCFDSDAASNKGVAAARRQLALFLAAKGASVRYAVLPDAEDGAKQGIDDYLGAAGRLDDIELVDWTGAAVGDGRPEFRVDNQAAVYDSLEQQLGSGVLYGFFRRHGLLVHVPLIGEEGYVPPAPEDGDDGPAQVRPVTTNFLRAAVQSRCYVCREDPKSHALVQTMTPPDPFRLAVEAAGLWRSVPLVDAVTHTPLLRADGTILTEPGYDRISRTLLLPDSGLELTPVPDTVDSTWVDRAVEVIDYLLVDFPFETDESKANMIALLATPVLRLIVPPPYPLFIMNAHQAGSGKTLLATIAGILHGGVHRPELPQNDEELRKQVSGILAATTAPVVIWDNATAIIKSPILASLLTTASWNDRLLGHNKDISARNDRVWLTTGNNVDIGGDMARRCYWVSLDPQHPQPEKRTDFQEPDLERYVERERGRILTALLVLARRWVQDGKPERRVRGDTYSYWSAAIAEILSPFGLTQAFRNQQQAPVSESADDTELGELLTVLDTIFPLRRFQVREVADAYITNSQLNAALPSELRRRQAAGEPIGKSLGRYLARNKQRYASGLRIKEVGKGHGGAYWQVERA